MPIVKQSKKRITDLCIYVDNNIYKEDFDKEKIFDALYNIVFVLAMKQGMFQNWDDYEPFSLQAACKLFIRLTNPRQFLPEDDPKKLKKVKSILNLTKKIIYPMKVDYQKANFSQEFKEEFDEDLKKSVEADLVNKVRRDNSTILKVQFEYYLSKISNTVKSFVEDTPYSSDPVIKHNIYISCLMTLLKAVTLSNSNKERLNIREQHRYNIEAFTDRMYLQEQEGSLTLFHLDRGMKDYIQVLVNRIKRQVVNDLKDLIGSEEMADDVITAILKSPLDNIVEYENMEG